MTVLSEAEIVEQLKDSRWGYDGINLILEVKKTDFAEALAFVNKVGELAEAANHHPDIDIRWNLVAMRLSTHSEGGITQLDFDLARSITQADESDQ